jgi:hypothetical protein
VQVDYINVKKDAAMLERMLGLSKGERTVPVIDEAGAITIGWKGQG